MIIENGYICLKFKSGGGIDENTGYPFASAETFSDKIPCQFIFSQNSLRQKVNGETYSLVRYIIYLEMQMLPDFECLRLFDRENKLIGDFSLLARPEPLEAVDQIKLLV